MHACVPAPWFRVGICLANDFLGGVIWTSAWIDHRYTCAPYLCHRLWLMHGKKRHEIHLEIISKKADPRLLMIDLIFGILIANLLLFWRVQKIIIFHRNTQLFHKRFLLINANNYEIHYGHLFFKQLIPFWCIFYFCYIYIYSIIFFSSNDTKGEYLRQWVAVLCVGS